MNLYLISQNINNGYDTYDSAVVAAPNEDMARHMHPNDAVNNGDLSYSEDVWCNPKDVQVKYIGLTELPKSVVCSSFNAG